MRKLFAVLLVLVALGAMSGVAGAINGSIWDTRPADFR